MSQPQYPVPAPRKRLPVWLWVVIAIFGVIFVCVTMIAGVGYYVAHRIAENPQAFIDKIVAANPNIEVVSRDADGRMTIRDRSNGKTVSINFDDFHRKGLRVFDGDKQVSIGGSGIEVRDGDKKVHVGAAAGAHVPAWIPVYPGSSTKASVEETGGGTVAFTTSDTPSAVAAYYSDTLKKAGFDVTTTGDTVFGRASNREITVTPERETFNTKVKIDYRGQ